MISSIMHQILLETVELQEVDEIKQLMTYLKLVGLDAMSAQGDYIGGNDRRS